MRPGKYPLEPLFGLILSPFERFLKRTTASGIILMATTLVTLAIANSPFSQSFQALWHQPFVLGLGPWRLEMDLRHLINDGLMDLFFLLVGLELKREILVGELSSFQDAALPVVAAAGGMLMPALLYSFVNPHGPAAAGWGIPMATDIAFSIGILVLLSWRIPRNLIIFLTALAIADDLGAVLLIALYYTQQIHLDLLLAAAACLAALALLNRGGIRRPLPYAVLGFLLWLALLKSGVHATVGGVLLAFAVPARPAYCPADFDRRLRQLQARFEEILADENACDLPLSDPRMATISENVEKAAKAVQSPLQRLDHVISPWVSFVIIPLFAFSNVAIDFSKLQLGQSMTEPVTVGVMLGLVVGKLTGIGGFSWLALKLGIGKLPSGVSLRHIFGVAWLGGIGFTMSLFISQLAFTEPIHVEQAKLGILAASFVSAVLGLIWLFLTGADSPKGAAPSPSR